MAEWYMRGEPHDQARLARILDVAQDLKVWSSLSWCLINSNGLALNKVNSGTKLWSHMSCPYLLSCVSTQMPIALLRYNLGSAAYHT